METDSIIPRVFSIRLLLVFFITASIQAKPAAIITCFISCLSRLCCHSRIYHTDSITLLTTQKSHGSDPINTRVVYTEEQPPSCCIKVIIPDSKRTTQDRHAEDKKTSTYLGNDPGVKSSSDNLGLEWEGLDLGSSGSGSGSGSSSCSGLVWEEPSLPTGSNSTEKITEIHPVKTDK